jgi:hypothetical protein
MFGRTVTIDGEEIFVCCLPSTPWPEVYRRAETVWKAKQEAKASDATVGGE